MTAVGDVQFTASLPHGRRIALRAVLKMNGPDEIRDDLLNFIFLIYQSLLCGDIANGLGVAPISEPLESPDLKAMFPKRKYIKKIPKWLTHPW